MTATRTHRTRTAPTAPTGIFGLPLQQDNPLVALAEGALFARPSMERPAIELPADDWALALDFGPAPVEPAPLVLAELPVARYAVLYFDTTAQALAAVDRDEVAEGDVLICDEESVAGVLVGSWVVAVTEDAEEFEVGPVPAEFADAATFAADFMG